MLEVWQNLASFGGRPISGAVEALLTEVINRRLLLLLIVLFFVTTAVSVSPPNGTLSMMR
jgi:hypothetical protein